VDPHNESGPVHPQSVIEVSHAIRNGQYKVRLGDGQDSCCGSSKEIGLDTKTSTVEPNEDSPVDKKQKRIADQ